MHELESIGAVYRNPAARWASPALVVPKPGTDTLRLTVDLRVPNSMTVPIQAAMPHLESRLQDTQGSTCYANIDKAHAYWQLALEEDSQEIHSIQTPIGVYTPTRILQGGTDSGNHYQAVTSEKFSQAGVHKILQWLDDFLIYSTDENELLEIIQKFFQVCSEFGFKVHAKKSKLFTKRVKFCGRILTAEGIQYDPRHFSALLDMKTPVFGSELQQLVCATNWMRNAIPDYARIIDPLHKLMEECYKRAGKRTKRAVRKLRIDGLWGAEHDSAFMCIKNQLAACTKLAYPKETHTMCMFTDASETHWSAVLTQVPSNQMSLSIAEQDHEPLCFLSGAFSGSSFNWSMPEKEGFSIVEAMTRLDYMTIGRTVSIFTDHANLVFIYNPYGSRPSIARHIASKLLRWAIKLSAFKYVVEHIPGELNVWADMMTRWAVKPRKEMKLNGKSLSLKIMQVAPVNPRSDSSYDWPVIYEIRE